MKLRYSPRARGDIDHIHEYISEHNRSAAREVVRQIKSTIELVARYPGLGRETDIGGVRVFPVPRYPYLIHYRLHENEVVIVHVRDGRRAAPQEGEFRG